MISFDFRNQLHEDCMKVSSPLSKGQSVTAGHCTGAGKPCSCTLMVTRATSIIAHCRSVRLLASSRITWSCKARVSLALQRDNIESICSLQNKQTSTKCPPRTMINRD